MTFTIFDFVLLFIVSISSFLGCYRGFVYIVVNIVGFIATIFLSLELYPHISSIISIYTKNDLLASVMSSGVSFIGSLVVFTLFTTKILAILKTNSLGIFDKFLGLCIGFLRGFILVIFIYIIVSIFVTSSYIGSANLEEMIMKSLTKQDIKKQPDWYINAVCKKYLDIASRRLILQIPKNTLAAVQFKNDQEEEKNIIDTINKKKGEVSSEAETSINDDLKNEIQELLNYTK